MSSTSKLSSSLWVVVVAVVVVVVLSSHALALALNIDTKNKPVLVVGATGRVGRHLGMLGGC